jgi:uncharacterized damage-inducible protein DinB
MISTVTEFTTEYKTEADNTLKLFKALTDASLGQSVAKDHRTVGRMAWHIITTYPEMTGYANLTFEGITKDSPMPKTAAEIVKAYELVSSGVMASVAKWSDADLMVEKNFYGENWKIGTMLEILIRHEIHHRAQMTVLMRQAGLKVPGVYGPSYEEWGNYGGKPPEV